MKKLLFASILLTAIAFACRKSSTQDAASKVVDSDNLAAGVIPTTAKINSFVLNPKGHSWKDLDEYYRNEVLVQHRQDSYCNNLRKTTIGFMVNQFDFLNQADLKDIEFYANELNEIDLPDPDVVIKVLTKLQGTWPSTRIADAGRNVYDRNMKFIQEQLKEPQDYMNKFGNKWDELKQFSATIK